MKPICKQDIVGARVTDIHASYEKLYGCDCTTIYFTVDRGFTFNLPYPGHEWLRVELPQDAEPLPDEYWEESFRVKKGWLFGTKFVPEPSRKIDIVKRIKERVIAGVYCPKPDEGLGFYEPDDAFLVFDDGSKVFCVTVAPPGIRTGLFYRTKEEAPAREDLVDLFDLDFGLLRPPKGFG